MTEEDRFETGPLLNLFIFNDAARMAAMSVCAHFFNQLRGLFLC